MSKYVYKKRRFKIQGEDSFKLTLVKMIYLIPFVIITYIPSILLYGYIEAGSPYKIIKELIEILKRKHDNSR